LVIYNSAKNNFFRKRKDITKMKVLVITDLCGGFSITLPERQLYKGLMDMGVEMTVVTHYETPESEDLAKAGMKIIYIPIIRKLILKL